MSGRDYCRLDPRSLMVRYSFLFTTLGFATVTLAVLGGSWSWGSWALSWMAANFVGIGLAYGARFPGIFGKRHDGSMRKLNVIVFFPFLLLSWTTWHAMRLFSRESAVDRIGRDLILARRLLRSEIPDDVDVVIDLTAEFPERLSVVGARRYILFPILDAGVPSCEALHAFLNASPSSGTVLIHCAQGHGRTAMIAACLLLKRGDAATADDAVGRILSVRPGARMNRHQRSLVAM